MTLTWVLVGVIGVPLLASVALRTSRRHSLTSRVRDRNAHFYNSNSPAVIDSGDSSSLMMDGGGDNCGDSGSSDAGGCDGGGGDGGGGGGD